MDILISDGDIAALSAGGYSYIHGIEEAVQRVLISVLTAKGSFVYDRELGTDYGSLRADDALITKKLDMLIKEACCDIAETDVEVISFDSRSKKAQIEVTYRADTIITEVDLSGII